MTSQVATASPTLVTKTVLLLSQLQRALIKRGKANPSLAMLAVTASIYLYIGRMRSSKKTPPRGQPVPHLKTRLYMLDVAYDYIRARSQGDELKWVQSLCKQGLTLTTEFVGHCLILAFEPSSVQHMLVKNFENYPKGTCACTGISLPLDSPSFSLLAVPPLESTPSLDLSKRVRNNLSAQTNVC